MTGYRISTATAGDTSLATECARSAPDGPAECVTIQAGIPVIEPGYEFGFFGPEQFEPADAIWPNEVRISFGGSNMLHGYMWIPDGWVVTSSGYYSLIVDSPGSFFRAHQLDGNGLSGIQGFSQGTVKLLTEPSTQFSPRGGFPTLSRAPINPDNPFGGHFALIGVNVWGDHGIYEADVRFDIAPNANTPNAPYVEPPCWVHGDVVPGYGPNYSAPYAGLDVFGPEVEEFLQYVNSFVGGCVAAVSEFFGSIAAAVEALERLYTEKEAFIYEKIAEIELLVNQFMDDFEGSTKALLSEILRLDLLREDPVRWVGTVGCGLLLEVLVAAAAGAGAALVATKLFQRIRAFLNNRRDRVSCPNAINSFPAGTLVLMADGSRLAIEDVEAGDRVLAYDTVLETWQPQHVLAQWSHHDDGQIVDVILDDGSSVSATDHHRFWTSNRGWVEAEDLTIGDFLADPDATAAVAGVEVWASGDPTEVWELSVETDNTFAVFTGTSDVVVHNEDPVPFDELDPYTWPNRPFDLVDENGVVIEKGYRSIWAEIGPVEQGRLLDELYDELSQQFEDLLPNNFSPGDTPWPDNDPDRIKMFDQMSLGQLRIAMMDTSEVRGVVGLRTKLESLGRDGGDNHEWIPVSRLVGAKAKGLTMQQIRDFTTLTTETNGTLVIRNDAGEIIGFERFEHNGANGGRMHAPLYEWWDDPNISAHEAIQRTMEYFHPETGEFRLDQAVYDDMVKKLPNVIGARTPCRGR